MGIVFNIFSPLIIQTTNLIDRVLAYLGYRTDIELWKIFSIYKTI